MGVHAASPPAYVLVWLQSKFMRGHSITAALAEGADQPYACPPLKPCLVRPPAQERAQRVAVVFGESHILKQLGLVIYPKDGGLGASRNCG